MRRQFVAQMGDTVALGYLSAQLADFANQSINLFLLLKNGLIDLF